MNSIQYYQVAGHIFRLQLPTESPLWKKLDNYAPFSIENPENVEPIFTLQITEAPTSYEPETNKCIGEFDCDAAYLKLFETTDGGRMFFISQGNKEKAYHLYTTTDYRSASLYFPADGNGAAYLENCERYVIPEFENKGADFLIRVSGDSMMPLYYSGDLLACHKIADIRFFQWGTVYVLETSQGVIVKRVHESEAHDDCVLCVSENNTVHKPFLLPKDDIRSLSTIIGLVRLI